MQDILEFALVIGVLSGAGLLWRLTAVFGRRFDHTKRASPELADLEARAAELEAGGTPVMADRLMELEERVDFAERVLSRQREQERLPPN